MSTTKKYVATAALAASLSLASASAHAALTFVGQWNLGDGITWSTFTAPTLTGQEAAALLFGGVASDYTISTQGVDPNAVDMMAWADEYGIGPSLRAQNFKVDSNNSGVYDQGGDTSAYVHDNDPGCFNRYPNPSQSCAGPNQKINYAFREMRVGVPEPGALMLLGLSALGLVLSRKRAQ